MLQAIHDAGDDGSKFIAAAKDKNSGKRLMGFGHRVYKNYDPRAKIIKEAADQVFEVTGRNPLLEMDGDGYIAQEEQRLKAKG